MRNVREFSSKEEYKCQKVVAGKEGGKAGRLRP